MPADSKPLGMRARKQSRVPLAKPTRCADQSPERTNLAEFDETNFGVIALDKSGRVLTANSAATCLLRERDAMFISEGRLLTALAEAQATLDSAIACATGHATSPSNVEWGLIARFGRAPITVLPLPLEISAIVEVRGTLLLYDPETQDRLSSSEIGKLYSLTRTESELCAALLDGYSLNEFAAERDVSTNTVRTLLARSFAKTGTRRQSDLVRLLASLSSLRALRSGIAIGMAVRKMERARYHIPMKPKLKLDTLLKAELDRFPDFEASLTVGEYAPGGVNKRHAHLDCLELIFVMSGAISTDIEGVGTMLTRAGEVLCLEPDIVHQGRNASSSEPAKMVIVKLKPRGSATSVRRV